MIVSSLTFLSKFLTCFVVICTDYPHFPKEIKDSPNTELFGLARLSQFRRAACAAVGSGGKIMLQMIRRSVMFSPGFHTAEFMLPL